jgi:hypothetical protein
MKHIDEHDRVKARIPEGQTHAVIGIHGDEGLPSYEDIDAPYRNVGPVTHEGRGQRTIAGSNVQEMGTRWDDPGEVIGQDTDTPVINVCLVNPSHKTE